MAEIRTRSPLATLCPQNMREHRFIIQMFVVCLLGSGCADQAVPPPDEEMVSQVDGGQLNNRPLDTDELPKSLTLNVGFDDDVQKIPPHPQALVFYAGEQLPIPDFEPMLRREWRLFTDLGIDPTEVTVVIRCDKRVSHEERVLLVAMCLDVGFQSVFLKTPRN
jgi:hypothetical protein